MSDVPLATFTTNTDKDSQKQHVTACSLLWSKGQQAAINRLTYQKKGFFNGSTRPELVPDYSARAARIAATYARFYLEQEEGCKPALKGRFYWMGLAAFASKQVKCGLDFVKDAAFIELLFSPSAVPMRVGKNYLGKGNFWLFQDIFVWHWFYAHYPQQFQSCAGERKVEGYAADSKKAVADLPWAGDALSILKGLEVNDYVRKAFSYIAQVETMPAGKPRSDAQLASLLQIADHEQRKILQPLIYEVWAFEKVLDSQALAEKLPGLPKRNAAFSTACEITDPDMSVSMTKGDLYNESDRMDFIGKIAKSYHRHMSVDTEYMEEQISEIAGWRNAL
jgi:hypothetical protein